MVISELALGLFTNLLYESFKNIPEYISDTSSKVYDKAIEEFSNKNYKLTGIQIDTFFHQENVEKAIEKYLKSPDKLDCSNILINEFFELFSEEDFSREDADLILNSFFEIIDAEIEKEPELKDYLKLYLAKQTYKIAQETNKGVQELSQDVKEISHSVQEIKEVINSDRENQDKKSGVDFEESLEKYLNKIIDEDGKNGISEVYTELSAKEILPVALKFHDEESDRPKEFEVLELVEKEDKLVISGESGSGKTTTLKWLNYALAKNYLEGKSEIIPLYIELNSYIGEERFIKKSFDAYVAMKAKEKGISEDILETILKGKATILLDGFDLLSPTDEFHPYDKISNFVTDYNNCRFVISSRPDFFESIKNSFKISELEKLTDEKIERFINRYVSNEELADTLKDKILSNQQLKSILSNPMMLYIAVKVAMGRKDKSDDLLPSNRSDLYEDFIGTLFSHQEEKGKGLHADRIQIENALTDLYFKLQCRNEVSCKYYEALKFVKKNSEDPIFIKISPQIILEDCFKLGILNRNDNYISYGIHQSFQEYFAAIKLKELFESGYDISEAFSHPKWEEVVIFTSEMLDSDLSDEFIELMLLKDELFLASKCVNKASNNTKEKVCALLANKMNSKYELEKINSIESLSRIGVFGISIIDEALKGEENNVRRSAIESLGKVNSEKAVKILIDALKDKDYLMRRGAAEALGNLKSEIAVLNLIKVMKDDNKEVKKLVIDALGNSNSEKAVQPLIDALKDKDGRVQESAVKALGKIKSEKAVKPLIDALKSNDKYVRWSVPEALGNIISEKEVQLLINTLKDEYFEMKQRAMGSFVKSKSEKAVQPLIDALKSNDEDVRWSVAEALGDIKSEKAVQPLIDALKDKDRRVRESATKALGKIKSEKAVQPLIYALKDKDRRVRESAAEALENIKSERAIQPLIDTLKDENESVQWSAIFALGNIKSERAEYLLINSFKNIDEDVRWSVVAALGNIKSEKAVSLLIDALKDKDEHVRLSAVESLGNIKSEKAVDPLINALKDEELRWSVVAALGDIKSEKAVQPLIDALKDKDRRVRENAAEALGKLKSEKAVQPLVEALNDEDRFVRWNAVEALGKLKSEEAVQPFIDLLEDEDENMRKCVVEALGKIKSEKVVQPLLLSSVNDEYQDVRWSAVEILENFKSEKAVQPLIEALNDEKDDVREMAAALLGNIGSEKAVQPLIEILKDKNSDIKASAAASLGNIGSEKAVQPLIDLLNDEDEDMQWTAAEALRTICTVKNKKQLEDLLKLDHEFSVNTAFEILNEIEKEEKSKLILFKDLKKRSETITKYIIFVSSVQKELENERVTIQDLVKNDPFLSAHYTPLLYEYEPAYPEKTLDGCLNTLNSCQVYLLIVGEKYGTLIGEISITHTEYRYAKEKNLPILIFIKGERNIEREEGTQALLREIDSDDFKYKRFKNVIELKNEVNESMKKLLRDEEKFLKT